VLLSKEADRTVLHPTLVMILFFFQNLFVQKPRKDSFPGAFHCARIRG